MIILWIFFPQVPTCVKSDYHQTVPIQQKLFDYPAVIISQPRKLTKNILKPCLSFSFLPHAKIGFTKSNRANGVKNNWWGRDNLSCHRGLFKNENRRLSSVVRISSTPGTQTAAASLPSPFPAVPGLLRLRARESQGSFHGMVDSALLLRGDGGAPPRVRSLPQPPAKHFSA